jgi:hypothetical protein
MPTLLAVTVGGSCAPVITAVRDYEPEFVCFIVSTGARGSRKTIVDPGNPCGDSRTRKCPECDTDVPLGDPKGANVLAQTGLTEEQYTLLELDDPDALPEIYAQIHGALARFQEKHEGWRFVADYTGGTKSMTVALALAALQAGYELSLVRGARVDLIRVPNDTQMAGLVNAGEVRARQQLAEAQRLFNAYAYASAAELLQSTLRAAPLSSALQAEIQEAVTLCRGFDAWDRFNHDRALRLLQSYQARVVPQWIFLKKLAREEPGCPLVMDLLRNAERRAARGRYDDAVARLYRTLEMLAQFRLAARTPPLDSSDLDVEALPESLRESYTARGAGGEKIRLGLREDYLLLEALDDPLGEVHRQYGNRLLEILRIRNHSILAHGLAPVSEAEWQEMHMLVTEFIADAFKTLKVRVEAPQFPQLEFGV